MPTDVSRTPGVSRLRGALVTLLVLVGAGFLSVAGYRLYQAWGRDGNLQPDLATEALADLDRRGYQPLSQPLARLLDDPKYKPIPTQAHFLLGETAPEFTLNDSNDKPWRLSDALREGPVVLVFYYGYTCNHCVSQLFGLNKDLALFRELGATVVAISPDPPALTRERYQQYGAFAFPVLSDPGNIIAASYRFARKQRGSNEPDLMHGTLVITRGGRVVWANTGEEPFTENRTLLQEVARARNR